MGIDPLRDVDRVGITEHGIVVSGDFRRANWEGLLGSATGAPLRRGRADHHGRPARGRRRDPGGDPLGRLAAPPRRLGRGRPPGPRRHRGTWSRAPAAAHARAELRRAVRRRRRPGPGAAWSGARTAGRPRSPRRRRGWSCTSTRDGTWPWWRTCRARTRGSSRTWARRSAARSRWRGRRPGRGGDTRRRSSWATPGSRPRTGTRFSLEVALPLEVVARRLAFCRGEADAGR